MVARFTRNCGLLATRIFAKKFAQVHRADCDNLILAISERLNLEKAGVKLSDVPARIVWFKDKLLPKAVLAVMN
jgi:predicted nuclease of restriction endonuclease-like RecB superfamily